MNGDILTAAIPLKLKSAGKDIIANGVAHTFDRDNFEIEIRNLKIIFEFVTDGSGQKLEQKTVSETSLKLLVYNFDNILGTGTISPIQIGTVSNKKLYLAFVVHCLSEKSIRTITYTFFLGEVVNG